MQAWVGSGRLVRSASCRVLILGCLRKLSGGPQRSHRSIAGYSKVTATGWLTAATEPGLAQTANVSGSHPPPASCSTRSSDAAAPDSFGGEGRKRFLLAPAAGPPSALGNTPRPASHRLLPTHPPAHAWVFGLLFVSPKVVSKALVALSVPQRSRLFGWWLWFCGSGPVGFVAHRPAKVYRSAHAIPHRMQSPHPSPGLALPAAGERAARRAFACVISPFPIAHARPSLIRFRGLAHRHHHSAPAALLFPPPKFLSLSSFNESSSSCVEGRSSLPCFPPSPVAFRLPFIPRAWARRSATRH